MADLEEKMSSAPTKSIREEDEDKDAAAKSKSLKKKKVRRHRIHKPVDSLGKVDEETDEEETERKKLSSRERIKLSMEGIDLDDVPTLNYVIEEKPPVVVVEDPEDEPPVVQEEPPVEEEEEIDEEEPCMTDEEKQAMYTAAALGDIDILEDCLDKPNSDINMVWFQENLLIAALKTEQEEMAEFLIDNGVDYNFTTTLINVREDKVATKDIEWEMCTCRQLAYDRGLNDITDLIDYLNGELFPFIKLRTRIPRYRRPKPPTPEPSTGGESENDAGSEASKDRSDDEGDGKAKKKKKKKKKDSREEDMEKIKEATSEKEKGERKVRKSEKSKSKDHLEINDEDSGHHSSESFADTEKDEDVRKAESADASKQTGSRASTSKTRTGSSRCSTSLTTTTKTRSPSPPPPRSETFLKRFCFINCPSDEGYSSLASSQRSPRLSETKLRRPRVPITMPPRGTKSSFGMRQASLHRKAGAEQDEERPLTQKKINIPGSYAAESSRWYKKSKVNMDSVTKSKNDIPTMTQTEVPKPQHARYMQMTASAYTKRRLEPNFRKAYSSLDFVSDRLNKSPQVSGNRKILHQRPSLNPRTYAKRGRENISLDLKTYNPSMLRPHSLPTSSNNQLFRTVIRVN